ncbi:Tatd-domain protein 3 [Spinellus fusiger]|nr:Tatd-domain protein 3 [Spinellus fusiger]
MIDVHAHIQFTNFPKEKYEQMIKQAQEAGVEHIVSVSESIHDAQDVLFLSRTSNQLIWAGLGLHPVQSHPQQENQLRSVTLEDYAQFEPLLKQSIRNKELCCVGEIGLDFSPHVLSKNTHLGALLEEIKNIQREVFRQQVILAIQADLPVNVHSRGAGHHALSILYECQARRVIMHAFDGKVAYAKRAVEAGYYFSIPPSVVRSPEKQKLVTVLPLSHLLLESDAPALGPHKDIANVPANILISAQEIARLKNISVDQVIKETTLNARKLFCKEKQANQ